MYSTRTRVHARIPNGHPREEKRASDKSPRTSRRSERAARAAADRLPRRAVRRLPREDSRAEVGEEVRVGVGVRVGPVEFKLYAAVERIKTRRVGRSLPGLNNSRRARGRLVPRC